MVIYIHGFGGSGEGSKAKEFRHWHKYFDEPFIAPSLSYVPELAIQTLEELIDSYHAKVTLIGSSLGGYYAIYLSNKYDLPAVLINPSIYPEKTLTRALGEAPNFYDESYYNWNEKHIEMLKAYRVENPKQENFMLLVQKGDEFLDANEALTYLPKAKQLVEEGGNHSFEGIDKHFRAISDFLKTGELGIVRRRLRHLSPHANIETLAHLQEQHKDKTLVELLQYWPRHMLRESPEYYYLLDEFLEKTVDIDMRTDDEEKRTALHIACGEGNIRAVEKLLLAGANPNAKDATGAEPLEYLVNYAWRAQIECYLGIYTLVKSGANLDNLGEDEESQTPLGWACIYGGNTLAVVSFLLESGADVNKKNHQGRTALMLAAKSDRTDLVMILLFFKADLHAKDNQGMTALDHAKKDKRQEVITFLEKQLA